MNNIEKVSIGGYAFSLEMEAYKAIKKYLDELERFYKEKTSGKEVMEGIEERMSELLMEQVGQNGVVSLQIVEKVIAILGRPSAIEAESLEDEASESEVEPKVKHRLFRDTQNKFIAGVLSGLATFFDIDVTILRAAVGVLGVLGFAFDKWYDWDIVWVLPIIYCIAWICMPAAKTVHQRLELRGQSGSVDEIQRDVENGEYSRREVHSDFWPVFVRMCKVCIGIVLFILGITGFLTGVFFALGASLLWPSEWILSWAGIVADTPSFVNFISPFVIKLICALVYFIPCIGMIYGSINMIFNLKPLKWRPGLILFLLWIVLILALMIWAFMSVIAK